MSALLGPIVDWARKREASALVGVDAAAAGAGAGAAAPPSLVLLPPPQAARARRHAANAAPIACRACAFGARCDVSNVFNRRPLERRVTSCASTRLRSAESSRHLSPAAWQDAASPFHRVIGP